MRLFVGSGGELSLSFKAMKPPALDLLQYGFPFHCRAPTTKAVQSLIFAIPGDQEETLLSLFSPTPEPSQPVAVLPNRISTAQTIRVLQRL